MAGKTKLGQHGGLKSVNTFLSRWQYKQKYENTGRWSRKAHALKTEVQEHAKLQQLKTDEEHSNPSNHTMQKY